MYVYVYRCTLCENWIRDGFRIERERDGFNWSFWLKKIEWYLNMLRLNPTYIYQSIINFIEYLGSRAGFSVHINNLMRCSLAAHESQLIRNKLLNAV